uniref:Derlin n=1 Tax=Rhabditophanes sp. KR3021 TaxID=114890 RepID=A0AC35TTV8_9BILA
MADLNEWYNSVPQITRAWMTGSIVLPLLGRFGLLSTQYMFLSWDLFYTEFHIWRPLTALFFYPITPATGFNWLLMIYFMYNYSKACEKDVFTGRPADYLFMLLFFWITSTMLAFAFGIYFLLEPMVLAVLYVWAQSNKETIVSFWFGTRFKAVYLPWVLLGFNMILRGGGLNEITGIIIGHLYYFSMVQYPQENGTEPFISTPEFLRRWLPDTTGGFSGFGVPPRAGAPQAQQPNARPAQHSWGVGRTLGSD